MKKFIIALLILITGTFVFAADNVIDGRPETWLRLAIEEFNQKNFEKAESYLSNINNQTDSDIKILREFYSAKILLEKDGSAANASLAEEKLLAIETAVKKSQIENLNDSFYSTLLQCKFRNEKWNEIPLVYKKIKNPGQESIYVLSSYYYKKMQYEKVDPSCGELYASSLCKRGLYEEACAEYDKLNSYSSDYVMALFLCSRFEKAYEISLQGNFSESEYMAGLCCINLRNWEKAVKHFASYITKKSSDNSFVPLSLYYKGYAEYNLAEFRNSYASFLRFTMDAPDKQNLYVLKAYEYAVKSALQNNDFKSAVLQAKNLVRYSPEGEQKQKAVILCAEILADYKSYEDAVELLAPYTGSHNDFAAQTIFMTAEIYQRQEKLSLADESYRRVYEQFPKSSYAEEAMYRSGEIYYSHEKYAEAYSRFTKYIYKYASGDFSDAALFYGGDCALRLGEIDRAIMFNKTLLQKYPASVYCYGANKILLSAFYQQENYSQALEVAKLMLKNFARQASDDGIEKRVIELEKIVKGTDRRIAEKETEFSKLGEDNTREGRHCGTELVKYYAESLYTQKEAFELASRLLKKQTEAEAGDAAVNAEFIADYNRKNGENKKAAEMYLKAAEFYRSMKNSSGAAASLYGAAEAFAADGFIGDARETAKLLKELYPQSIQAERVDRVTGDARN